MEEELNESVITADKATKKNRKKSIANAAKLKKIASNNKDKEAKLNRRADRIAARRNFEGTGKFYTNSDGMLVPDAQDGKFIEARKKGRKIIADRKAARKQYLRNFASQLARGEQATPRTGFGQGEGNPNADTSLAGNSGTQQEVSANNEMAGSDYKDIFSTMANIGNDNSSLTSASYDRGMSGLLKLDEDSTPNNYMQKQYRKKRGY